MLWDASQAYGENRVLIVGLHISLVALWKAMAAMTWLSKTQLGEGGPIPRPRQPLQPLSHLRPTHHLEAVPVLALGLATLL